MSADVVGSLGRLDANFIQIGGSLVATATNRMNNCVCRGAKPEVHLCTHARLLAETTPRSRVARYVPMASCCEGATTEIRPPQLHWHVESITTQGIPAIRTETAPGAHGVPVAGTQG